MTDHVHRIGDDEARRIQRFLYILAGGTVAFVVLVLLGLVTADRWLLFISNESERRFIQPYIEWADKYILDEGDLRLQAYVSKLALSVASQMDVDADLTLEFRVIKGKTVNAFTTLGGHIYIYEGLVKAAENENGLTMIIAHEIAHAKNRDPLLGTGRGMLLQLMLSTFSGGAGIDPGSINAGSELMLYTYSREQEQTADLQALTALQRRFGHVGGATQVFSMLRASLNDSNNPELLSSHPHLDRRMEYIQTMSREQGWMTAPTAPYPTQVREIITQSP